MEKLCDIEEFVQTFEESDNKEDFSHKNEGYVVRVHFEKNAYSATDAVKHYLKQIAQLKY